MRWRTGLSSIMCRGSGLESAANSIRPPLSAALDAPSRPTKKPGPFRGRVWCCLAATRGSEALGVLQVHETTDVEAAVVRDVGARLAVHHRTILLEHVVGTDGDGRIPRRGPAELHVVERHRAGAP